MGRVRLPPQAESDLIATNEGTPHHGNAVPSSSWFKLGFPSGYVADVLQNLEVLAHLGHAKDPRLDPAYDFVLGQQEERGRWRNRYAYNRKTTVDIEHQGDQSK